ncbi:histidine kinase [Pseudomonas dryadis]|uniref:histidine kinase n=2 Tax=Phytopseudomonas dryadis TaxID=2487520 RepID=A0A4Q9QX79_9GAMM|nr:histidine kinase [Pseudomonas dryadis]
MSASFAMGRAALLSRLRRISCRLKIFLISAFQRHPDGAWNLLDGLACSVAERGGRMFHLLMRRFPLAWTWRREPPSSVCRASLLELPLRLLQQPDSDAPLLSVLPQLGEAVQARAIGLLLPQSQRPGWRRLGDGADAGDCLRHADGALPLPGAIRLCRACLAVGRYRVLCGLSVEDGRPAMLWLQFAAAPTDPQCALLRDLARRFGEVLQAFGEDRRLRRRELSAERAVLARELHDSVAQQLGYLQIRASRLQAVLDDPAQRDTATDMLGDLRDTLQLLQRQVRELISGARLTMDGRSLRQALEASVEEFSRRSRCVFSLDNRLPADRLSPTTQLQVLQIVREALANVVRHSHARQVRIQLRDLSAGGIEVQVSDDGVGLPDSLPLDGHFGLRIMQERAATIGAELWIGSLSPHGTCVRLRWGCP